MRRSEFRVTGTICSMLFLQSTFLEKHFGAESERLRNYYYFPFATRQWGGTALAATRRVRSRMRPVLLSAKTPAGPRRPGGLASALGASPLPGRAPGSRQPTPVRPPGPGCVSHVNSRVTAVCATDANTKSGGCPALRGSRPAWSPRLWDARRPGRAPGKGLHCPPASQGLRRDSHQAFGAHAHGDRKRRCRR